MLENFESNLSKIIYFSLDKNKIPKVINKIEAEKNKTDNIYFTYWISKKSKTRKKEDFLEKKGFMIDLDLRKNYENKYMSSISDEEIIKEWINIWENLKKENQILWEISYIVFSWNWLQIHYIWNWQQYTPEEYFYWVKEIYKLWDEFWGDYIYTADPACANISRMMRLPWTINQKNWAETKIIYSNPCISYLADNIKIFYKKALQKIEEEEIKNNIIIKKGFSFSENWFYEEINKIPAYELAQFLIPEFKLNKNGKNFDNHENGFTWYFYNKKNNTICNWGSRHFNYWDVWSCYNNFSLIKHFYNFTNKETFDFFKKLTNK